MWPYICRRHRFASVELQVQTTINNLILGKIYIQHTGTYTVRNHDTGLTAVLELVKPKMMTFSLKSRKESQHLVRTISSNCSLTSEGMMGNASETCGACAFSPLLPGSGSSSRFGMRVQIHGHLEKDGKKLDKPAFHGKWDEALYADLADGSQRLLWQVNPVPAGENR